MAEITLAHKAAEAHCGYHRYLRYHVGGTGIVPVSSGPLLVTDDAIRTGVAAMTGILRAHDRLPTTPEMREIVSQGQQGYDDEQRALLSGLLWATRLTVLPWLHKRYRVVAVNTLWEYALTAETTLTGTLDLVAEPRAGHGPVVFHISHVAQITQSWCETWALKPWLALGYPTAEHYVIGLATGRRTTGDQPQQTPLCYGYRHFDDWLPAHEWTDQDGVTHRVSKQYRRQGIWKLAACDWPVWTAYRGQDPDLPVEEFWVRHLPTSVLQKVTTLVGPLTYHPETVEALKNDWVYSELERARLPVPRSWHCRYCDYVPICHHQIDGDPLESGRFVPRQEP